MDRECHIAFERSMQTSGSIKEEQGCFNERFSDLVHERMLMVAFRRRRFFADKSVVQTPNSNDTVQACSTR
jgi:hypothetical protein